MLRRRAPLALVAALLAVLAGALSACGSGGDVNSVLRQTFGSSSSVKSGRLDLALEATTAGQASTGPVGLRLTGPFQSTGAGRLPRFDFTLDIASGGKTMSLGGVSTGDRGYLRLLGQTYQLSPQLFGRFQQGYRQAQKQSAKQKGPGAFRALGIDPSTWLRNPRKSGTATVGGTQTIHITSGIRVHQLLADLGRLESRAGALGGSGQALSPQRLAQLEGDVGAARVDIYTGQDDKLLRKLDLEVQFKPTAKSKGGLLRFDLELDGVNQAQRIVAPAHAQPLNNLLAALQAAAGQSGSSSGSAGSSPGTTTTPAPSAPSAGGGQTAYLRCIQAAGADLAKAQRCASLLGG